ncbi:MAG: hypothetical protein JNM96_02570 [Bacteroidia bacterium]|nr:hypothetical protein [Bacteroidia bacterium]
MVFICNYNGAIWSGNKQLNIHRTLVSTGYRF